ncbi:beta-hexosaminidase, partial [bacterium]
MKKCLTLSILFILSFTTLLIGENQMSGLNLMPMPEKVVLQEGTFRLDRSFAANIEGGREDLLFEGVVRMLTRLTGRTGIFLFQPVPFLNSDADTIQLKIKANRAGQLKLYEDESYKLTINSEKIHLTAESDIGILRGLETLLQLLDADENGYFFPAITIEDAPRFPWRGILIDACRHFIPVHIVKRNLDAMAAVKMNVLHWHLTEDQGFRIESNTFPKLHQLGSDGLYYTQQQIKDVVAYAAERGIRVVPEFDLPGHATSWLVGYPELASAPGPYTIERNWGIFDPTFDPTREEVYVFLEKFFKEMALLFPEEYWHIGGDENNGHQWDANPDIQEFMKKNDLNNNHALQNYFNQRIEKILDKLGKTMVGWYTDAPPDLDKKYIIQSWKGRASLYESARNSYRCLLSHGFYIDLIQPTVYHYLNDPIPADSVLKESEKELILGGEATMWAEFVGPETIDSRIWPRTAAIAERLWSPGSVNDIDDMFRRLDNVSFRLEELGLTHEKNYDMMLRRLA